MEEIDKKQKITIMEEALNVEKSNLSNLKKSAEEDRKYLMNSLEAMSNNFDSNSIIEDAYMLPQLFRTLNESLSKVNASLMNIKDLEKNVDVILFNVMAFDSKKTESVDLTNIENELDLYNDKKREVNVDIFNNTKYVKKFISSSRCVIDNILDNSQNSKENLIKKFKEERNNSQNLDYIKNVEEISDNQIKDNEIELDLNNVSNISQNDEIQDTGILYKPYKLKENDTLLISEKQAKIFLPYTLSDLNMYAFEDEDSLKKVIDENFVLPLDIFKNSTMSRFKETYNLARKKSNCSLIKSFNYSVESMFKYSLNPAIIVACKHIDELQDYLTCLKNQKLDEFKSFKIQYEINPIKSVKILPFS